MVARDTGARRAVFRPGRDRQTPADQSPGARRAGRPRRHGTSSAGPTYKC